jgi:hypothetical protein
VCCVVCGGWWWKRGVSRGVRSDDPDARTHGTAHPDSTHAEVERETVDERDSSRTSALVRWENDHNFQLALSKI